MSQTNANLTPPIATATSIPFPFDVLVKATDATQPAVSERRLSDTEKITVSVCSEFTTHVAPVTTTDGNHRVAILQEVDGNPLVISIGSDNRLYCVRHITGNNDGWNATDITPNSASGQSYKVTAFDAGQDMLTNNVNLIVAATLDANVDTGLTDVFSILGLPLTSDTVLSELSWTPRNANLDLRHVTVLRVSQSTSVIDGIFPFAIAGTRETDKLRASDYLITLDPSNNAPWNQDALAKVATKVIAVEPGRLRQPINQGAFTLFQDAAYADKYASFGPDAGDSVNFQSFPTSTNPKPTLIVVQLTQIGNIARDITPLNNARGETDLIVAGNAGLGYYTSAAMDRPPIVILPAVSFDQVVAAQAGTSISILASSVHGELYYIEGSRVSPNANPTFSYSGLPIRTGVQLIGVHRNKILSCTECTYVNQDGALVQLWRDPTSGFWSEQLIKITALDKQTSTPAYVTHVALQNSEGSSVPGGYILNVTSDEVAYVLINDQTYTLDSNPTAITTDATGVVTIIYPVDSTLGCPEYTLMLQEGDASASVPAYPAQRVMRVLAGVKSADDLTNATSTTGNPVFSGASDDSKKATSAVLQNLSSMITTIDSDAPQKLGNGITSAGKDLWVSLESIGGSWTVSSSPDESWVQKATDFFDHIGDFFENAGKILNSLLKCAVRVADSVVEFFLEVGGAVLKFALKSLAIAVRSLAVLLKNTLGIDFTGLLDWLSFIFDWDNIIATQQVLANFVTNGANLLSYSIEQNKPFFAGVVASARSAIQTAIPDYRGINDASSNVSNTSSPGSSLKKWFGDLYEAIFNNPIVKGILDVLSKITGAVTGIFADVIEVPGVTKIFSILANVVTKVFGAAATAILDFLQDIYNKFQDFLASKISFADLIKEILSDAFWEMFDVITEAILASLDAAGELIQAFLELFTGAWKIPIVTTIWKFITGTDLSIVNIITIPMAIVMNITSLIEHGKLPYDGVYPDPSTFLPAKANVVMKADALQSLNSKIISEKKLAAASPHNQLSMKVESVEKDQATDEPEDPALIAKETAYRRTDAFCGTFGALLSILNVIIEVSVEGESQDTADEPEDIEMWDFSQFDDIDLSDDVNAPLIGSNSPSIAGKLKRAKVSPKVGAVMKFAISGGLLALHLASFITMVDTDGYIPEPRRTQWVVIKSLGVALNVTSLGLLIGSFKFPAESQPRESALLASTVLSSVSSLMQTCITGFWEYNLAIESGAKTEFDDKRFSGDFFECVANCSAIVSAVFEWRKLEIPWLVSTATDAVSTTGAIVTLGILDDDYRNGRGLEESG